MVVQDMKKQLAQGIIAGINAAFKDTRIKNL